MGHSRISVNSLISQNRSQKRGKRVLAKMECKKGPFTVFERDRQPEICIDRDFLYSITCLPRAAQHLPKPQQPVDKPQQPQEPLLAIPFLFIFK